VNDRGSCDYLSHNNEVALGRTSACRRISLIRRPSGSRLRTRRAAAASARNIPTVVVAHDFVAVPDESLLRASLVLAGSLGLGSIGAGVREAVKSFL